MNSVNKHLSGIICTNLIPTRSYSSTKLRLHITPWHNNAMKWPYPLNHVLVQSASFIMLLVFLAEIWFLLTSRKYRGLASYPFEETKRLWHVRYTEDLSRRKTGTLKPVINPQNQYTLNQSNPLRGSLWVRKYDAKYHCLNRTSRPQNSEKKVGVSFNLKTWVG